MSPAQKKLAAVVAVLLLIAAALTWRSLPLGQWIQEFAARIKNLGASGIFIFIVAFVLGAICMLPASLFTIAAGIAFGFIQGSIVAIAGATIGAAASFLIARYLLRSRIERWLARSEKRKAFDAAIARGDWKVVLLLRLTPVIPFVLCNYFLGLTRVRFWPYLIASAIGVIPGAILYTYLGYLGKIVLGEKRQRTPMEYALLGVGLLSLAALVIYITRLSKKQMQQFHRPND
jgi:uncharacterized membrane protein YdjX (TVP38/TMEM64 family)